MSRQNTVMRISIVHRSSFYLTTVVVLVAIADLLYILIPSTNGYLSSKVVNIEQQLQCASCFDCVKKKCNKERFEKCKKMQQVCRKMGWEYEWSSQSSMICMKNKDFVDTVEKEVKREYRAHKEDFRKNLRTDEKNKLEDALYAFADPPRIIFHWFPHCWNRNDVSGWQNLSDYERYASTYTISTGPPDSCEKDTYIVVPEDGMYNIYGKLTFSCDHADQKSKRVQLEVAKIDSVGNQQSILLRDEDRNTCWMEGDLTTLYQSGLFELKKGDEIFIRYESSTGVKLSSNLGSPFKSSIGAYRVGSSYHNPVSI